MAFITINHHAPADNGAAFVAENATLAGSVRLEKNSSVWYGAVLRADTGRIAIGENSNVQDNAVLHTGPGRSRPPSGSAGKHCSPLRIYYNAPKQNCKHPAKCATIFP